MVKVNSPVSSFCCPSQVNFPIPNISVSVSVGRIDYLILIPTKLKFTGELSGFGNFTHGLYCSGHREAIQNKNGTIIRRLNKETCYVYIVRISWQRPWKSIEVVDPRRLVLQKKTANYYAKQIFYSMKLNRRSWDRLEIICRGFNE